jgi:hypothetical protein
MSNQIIVNPFLNMVKNDTDIKTDNIFIICNNSDIPIDKDIYQYYIEENKLNEIKKKILLVKTNKQLIRNINHKNKLIMLSDNF